jgi:hypothetical protein
MSLNPFELGQGFTISPAFNGKTFWDLTQDGNIHFSSFGEWTITPNVDIECNIKMWGAGGASGVPNYIATVLTTPTPVAASGQTYGGSGGYTSGDIIFRSGVSYIIRVGQGGARVIATDSGATYLAGGQNLPTKGGVQAGGYSGIFKSSVTQANALLMAGGGGAGGTGQTSFNGGNFLRWGGSGGGISGTTASAGPIQIANWSVNGGAGGTQTAGGEARTTNATGVTSGGALIGGLGANNATGLICQGGGGGGYFGGGGGGGTGGASGGGGGSGRIGTDADVFNGLTLTGKYAIPPNHLDTENGRAGLGGFPNFPTGSDGTIIIKKTKIFVGTLARGGIVSVKDGFVYHYYPYVGSGTFEVVTPGSFLVLVVGGGGAGGQDYGGGGGGAGGVLLYTANITTPSTIGLYVGNGGANAGFALSSPLRGRGGNGENSTFDGVIAFGGGGGGACQYGTIDPVAPIDGADGGSGGGAGPNTAATSGGLGTAGQGNNGGSTSGDNRGAAGGGGAGGVGGNNNTSDLSSGNGGPGLYIPEFSQFGEYGYFGGGGGGGCHYRFTNVSGKAGAGGIGGGGHGGSPIEPFNEFPSRYNGGTGLNGKPYTGGGGGGCQDGTNANNSGGGGSFAGNGGSGVIIVRYAL